MDFPGRLLRERSSSAATHDIMNDPTHDTGKGKEREHEEPDTCRICRGEGTEQDELYYPCKCSGSIRFVHQPCLVQWLAHSQKKHCELCKTPFHFTKVYDPDMPESLPTLLFMKQLSIHCVRAVVTWLRWVLVAFVWLGWLPWSMRAIWRALFWLADGRWSSADASQQGYHDRNVSTSFNDATLASSSVVAEPSSGVGESSPSVFDFSTGEPILLKLMRKAFSTLFFPAMSTSYSSSNTSNVTTTPLRRRPSWLSDVKFLNTLTPSPTINNILIDTLEGQLITLLVVVSFILVFLIREWVVQQQPLDNIAEGEREAADQLIANNRHQVEAPEPDPEHPEDLSDEDSPQNELNDVHADEAADNRSTASEQPDEEPLDIDSSQTIRDLLVGAAGGPVTPRSPQIDEPRFTINMELYRDLQRRSNGDLEEMSKIIREEGRIEELVSGLAPKRHAQSSNGYPRSRLSDSTNADAEVMDEPAADEPRPASPNWSFATSLPHRDDSNFAEAHSVHAHLNQPESQQALRPDVEHNENENTEGETPSGTALMAENGSNGATGGDAAVVDTDSAEEARNIPGASQTAVEHDVGMTQRVINWFWADVVPDDLNQGPETDLEEDVADEPAVNEPLEHPDHDDDLDAEAMLPEIDPNEVDAVEEADDLEGILELIGMQGPIFGLLQNGVFCALLISFTVAAGIWLPYLAGKVALVLLAHPIQFILGVPMTAISVLADVVIDTLIGSLGYIMYWTNAIGKLVFSPFAAIISLDRWTRPIASTSLSLIDASSQRLSSVVNTFFVFHEADVPMFSVLSHLALKIHEARIASLFRLAFLLGKFALYDVPLQIGPLSITKLLFLSQDSSTAGNLLNMALSQVYDAGHDIYARFFLPPSAWVSADIIGISAADGTIDSNLAVWDTKDRTIAIFMGYILASAVGLVYLRAARFFSGTDGGQRVEGMVAEGLHQAGGVMKVILIIGIEMIVFPLYCGALLDAALLPLFENATLASRIDFTSAYPLTSLFVHWFVGTCYMFHFALFVSMCRKTMRSGVLYFIRDPDDPTFHPVRDVLERNITTQLRKIAFSALVYGALVIVCLGGVVWGIYYGFDGVLPAHWSSSDPVLEFPIDLLLYNFGIPLAIKFFKPSDGLHSLYRWWFRKCARFLRLSDFFFGEKHADEEGKSSQPGDSAPPEESVTEIKNRHISFERVSTKRDGRFVRVPASDQVRIPKGSPVFVEVNEANERIDGKPDTDQGLHGRLNNQFTKVYIPPSFRSRIATFIFFIWMFAAATGVGTTIIPLIVGRKIMSYYLPGLPVNDVYALFVGMGVACSAACVLFSCRAGFRMMTGRLGPYLQSSEQVTRAAMDISLNAFSVLYIVGLFLIFLPSIIALAIELYLLVPVNTYVGHEKDHVIHFVQDWTLGVLYVQMAVKLALWHTRSRPAAVLKGIFRDGWLKPNAKLATRALLLPATLLALVAIMLPLSFGFVTNFALFSSCPEMRPKVYRYAYPVTLAVGLVTWLAYLVCRQVEVWKVSIRDEFFLIGERLHNFREKRARDVGVSRRVITG
ncbi:hypothetical protein BDW74DRAFT_144705 [Aspergillus multicolor]|uniref:E3 ubiquitin-protein ligase SSM4 n=1 Tax=Aspergillus multicolor TaxID=41759 RepID=UPI003CCE2EB5